MSDEKEFKHCGECSEKKKALCSEFRTCLGGKGKKTAKKGDKKPVGKGTYG